MIDWLLVSCFASFVSATALGIALFLNWQDERRDPFDDAYGDWPFLGDK